MYALVVPGISSCPLRGGVDRNSASSITWSRMLSLPPARGRGSKPVPLVLLGRAAAVAPCAGAWIETPRNAARSRCRSCCPLRGGVDRNAESSLRGLLKRKVAPCAGAWIETPRSRSSRTTDARCPLRGGVDRNRIMRQPHGRSRVAPCAGAWIETTARRSGTPSALVAPCAGAWIETAIRRACHGARGVAPCAGAWIETASPAALAPRSRLPPARGRGSKRAALPLAPRGPCCPLRGGVDRNAKAVPVSLGG